MRRSGPTRDERDLFDELIRIAGETPFRPPAEEARIRELLALAHRHALAGLVATRLLERSGEIPDASAERLRAVADGQRRHAVAVLLVADAVGRALTSASVPCLVLKGAGLLGLAYRTLAERDLGDLDVLVPRARMPEAERALASSGFEEAVAPRSRGYFERYHFHIPWRSGTGVGVDLHWDVVRPADGFRPDLEGTFARSVAPALASGTFRVPCATDAILLQCLQHHQEGFRRLSRAVDLDRLSRRLSAAEWEDLVVRALDAGLGPLAWAGLETSRLVFGTPVPPSVSSALAPRALARVALESLRTDLLLREAADEPDPAIPWLVRIWTAPDGRRRLRVLRHLLALEPGFWEDRFFVPRSDVPLARRVRARWQRLAVVARVVAEQSCRLASRGTAGRT